MLDVAAGGHIPVPLIIVVIAAAALGKHLLVPLFRQQGTLPATQSTSRAATEADRATAASTSADAPAGTTTDTTDPLAFTFQGSPLLDLGISQPPPDPTPPS